MGWKSVVFAVLDAQLHKDDRTRPAYQQSSRKDCGDIKNYKLYKDNTNSRHKATMRAIAIAIVTKFVTAAVLRILVVKVMVTVNFKSCSGNN